MKILDKFSHFIKKTYYYFKWGSVLYPISNKLDFLLVYLEKFEIVSIEISNYECVIVFGDYSKLIFWNANRWYGWMNSGQMYFSNGKSIKWSSKSPSCEVLYKYRKLINNNK